MGSSNILRLENIVNKDLAEQRKLKQNFFFFKLVVESVSDVKK